MRSRITVVAAVVVLATLLLVPSLLRVALSFAGQGRSGQTARFVEGAADDTTTPFNLVSIPALVRHHYDGRDLRLGRLLGEDRYARRWAISYTGDGLRLTGTLVLPRGRGSHPVVVAAHGYIPPPKYRTGAGLIREEARLARLGFVVLHPDYRNYAGSQRQSSPALESPLGYPADVLNAVLALQRAHLGGVDMRHLALLGRSMGGGVALQVAVARPSWFDALVLYSPVSSEAGQDYARWVQDDPSLRHRVQAAYGDPQTRPTFWHDASVANYLGRLGSMPVQLHHGTHDRTCPEFWSLQTAGAMRADGVPVTFYAYSGEQHRFSSQWPLFISRAGRFLQHALR